MKRLQLGLIAFVAVTLLVPSFVRGATIKAGIDGAFVDVPTFVLPPEDGGYTVIGDPETGKFVYDLPEGKVEMSGYMSADPFIDFALAVTDLGAPSAFSFSYVMPLLPNVMNPSFVSDSLSGSVTNPGAAGGVTVTPLAPPAGIPVDGDGVAELQVFTLSPNGGVTWRNVGLDSGPLSVVPLGHAASGVYVCDAGVADGSSCNQGPIFTVPAGPWTDMRADLNFSLSGDGDIFTFNGAKNLFTLPGNTPEPSSALLGVLAAALVGLFRTRK